MVQKREIRKKNGFVARFIGKNFVLFLGNGNGTRRYKRYKNGTKTSE